MIGYTVIGTNDLEDATEFYDNLLKKIGGIKVFESEEFVTWSFGKGLPMFSVTVPSNEQKATVGNGAMIALKVDNAKAVDNLYEKAIELGGTNEGAPGLRGEGFYAAYFRDLDGNKLNFFCYVKSSY